MGYGISRLMPYAVLSFGGFGAVGGVVVTLAVLASAGEFVVFAVAGGFVEVLVLKELYVLLGGEDILDLREVVGALLSLGARSLLSTRSILRFLSFAVFIGFGEGAAEVFDLLLLCVGEVEAVEGAGTQWLYICVAVCHTLGAGAGGGGFVVAVVGCGDDSGGDEGHCGNCKGDD